MSRLELHSELLKFVPNAYFQPPSNIKLTYPCVVYSKTVKSKSKANNLLYMSKQGYRLTLMEKTPDSPLADEIESGFNHCSIVNYYTADGLNHTILDLYY